MSLRIGSDHPSWRGGKYVNFAGYVLIRIPEHARAGYNGYVFEHIVIAEDMIGRSLRKDECVHHINHNKADNRQSNLKVMTQFEHKSHHGKERHKKKHGGH